MSPSFLGVSHILAKSTGTLLFSDDFRREHLGSFCTSIELGAFNGDGFIFIFLEFIVPGVDCLFRRLFRFSYRRTPLLSTSGNLSEGSYYM